MTTIPSREPVRLLDEAGGPTATLEEIDIRSELVTRPQRAPDYEREARTLTTLAKEMANNPRNVLQKLVEVALDLCHADTAGISLLQGDVFRWEAVAGVFASHRDGTMPRSASPCGVCIDQNLTQLMHLPDRLFPALRAEPRFVEALLIPFQIYGTPAGTVWIVSHSEGRKFDQEDERIVRTLSQFASAGWQLWTARDAAEAASRRKDEFLAMLSHELRNPLAAIVSATHVLQAVGSTGHEAPHAIDVVARQSQHLARMVDDLLDLARLSTGKLELKSVPVELHAVVAAAVETSRAQIERRAHQLSINCPSDPIWLKGDAVRLAQLIANLLDNAAKYTPEHGQISLSASLEANHVEIVVRDTGIGIPADQLGAVFDLYTQIESSAAGLGLGLKLVRDLAMLHGGSAEAASEGPGRGSQFTIRLPTIETPRAISPPVPIQPAPSNYSAAYPRRGRQRGCGGQYCHAAQIGRPRGVRRERRIGGAQDAPSIQARRHFARRGLAGNRRLRSCSADPQGYSGDGVDHHCAERLWAGHGPCSIQGGGV